MTKKDEIENEIERIWAILILAKECFHYSSYLFNPETKKELDYIEKSADLCFLRHIIWRTTVIELSKLFSESQTRDRYNICHFINKFKKGGHFGDTGISDNLIQHWKSEINENKTTIDTVLKYRDKVYAHDDPNQDVLYTKEVTFEQAERLMKIVESLITEIYETILDSTPVIETVIFDRLRFDIIKILAEAKECENNFSNRK
ncbi:MAG: hypothetical protein C0397_03105 [Odoribacter sp.]|nr:hypothetical protein [Odoribacter sp.]